MAIKFHFRCNAVGSMAYGKLGRFCIRCNALLFNLVIHHNLGRIEVNGGMLGGAHDVEHHLAATANFNRCRRGSRTLFYLAYGKLQPPPLAPFAAKPSANENLRCCVDRNRHLREIVQIVCNALRPNCHPSCLIGSVGRFVALKSEDRVVKNIVEVFYPSSLVNQGYGMLRQENFGARTGL